MVFLADRKFRIDKLEKSINIKTGNNPRAVQSVLERLAFQDIETVQNLEVNLKNFVYGDYMGFHRILLIDSFLDAFSEYNDNMKAKNFINDILKRLAYTAHQKNMFVLGRITSELCE